MKYHSYNPFITLVGRFSVLVLLLTLFLIVLFDPAPASANAVTSFFNCTGVDCSACNIVYTANRVITWLVAILFMVFAILMVKAGFGLVTSGGNPSAMTAAKDSFTSAIIGLIIILAAWIIVDTVIRGLGVTGLDRQPFPWSEVQCQVQVVPFPPDPPASAEQLPINPNAPVRQAPTDRIGAAEVRSLLSAGGVTVQSGVESLEGLSRQRVEQIATLAQQCAQAMRQSCGVELSSGVRTAANPSGMGSHGTGNAVDLSARSAVFNDWMMNRSGFARETSFGGYSGYRIPGSNTLCTWESRGDMDAPGAHWHCDPR